MRWLSATPAGMVTSIRRPSRSSSRLVPPATSSSVTSASASSRVGLDARRPAGWLGWLLMPASRSSIDPVRTRVWVRVRPASAGRAETSFAGEERSEEVAEAGQVVGIAAVLEVGTGTRGRAPEAGERAARPLATGLLVRLPVAAQLVVQLALVGVGQDLVRLADLLELLLGRGIAAVDVGVVLAG